MHTESERTEKRLIMGEKEEGGATAACVGDEIDYLLGIFLHF